MTKTLDPLMSEPLLQGSLLYQSYDCTGSQRRLANGAQGVTFDKMLSIHFLAADLLAQFGRKL